MVLKNIIKFKTKNFKFKLIKIKIATLFDVSCSLEYKTQRQYKGHNRDSKLMLIKTSIKIVPFIKLKFKRSLNLKI